MSAAANKKLVQQVYTDSANRSGTTFVDNLAEDATWIVTGQYSWSHEFKGRDAINNGLMGHFRSFFAARPRTLAFNFIAEGDYVVGQWEGGGTHTGPAFSDFLVGRLPANTGRKMHFTGTTVLKVINGKIVQEIGLDDGVTALTQLGLIKAS